MSQDDNPYEQELIIEQIEIGPMQNFTYLVGSRSTREVVIVDPAWDIDGLVKHINERDYVLKGALVTHYHPDHCGGSFGGHSVEGVAELLEHQGLKVYVHQAEADGLKKVTGISDSDMVKVASGDTLSIGDVDVEFLHTPGHTPGSQCFRIKQTLVSGDTLFIQGCGRVDLPGSDSEDMYRSLRKLAELPDDTLLLPGHNYGHVPNATMGETKQQNAYLRVDDLNTWKMIMGG
jgi:glyoxylase-like metal-dependent hydrolase (beta-lactamase superfamily II)